MGETGRDRPPDAAPYRVPRPGEGRPGEARPGAPPPWAHLDPARRRALALSGVRQALEDTGKGPSGGPPRPAGGAGGTTPSAVLVALFEESGETRVVLTRRSESLSRHRGEVSFPGGRMDRGESALQAALREASEEVALDPAQVVRAGWLAPVVTFGSGSHIQPVVGALPGRPVLSPNPVEVARVFDVALAELVADGAFREECWRVPGRAVPGDREGWFPVWFFQVAGEVVWGATARILMELLTVALRLGPPAG